MLILKINYFFRGEGSVTLGRGRSAAGHRTMLPSESDAVGVAGAADTAERDRSDSASAHVQLAQSHCIDQTEGPKHTIARLRR